MSEPSEERTIGYHSFGMLRKGGKKPCIDESYEEK